MTSTEREQFLNAGFTTDQIAEIEAGIKAGVNVSIYADKDFLAVQMRQIRLGMQEGLPVEIYAKKEFDWFQMEDIRKGLKLGVDVSVYAKPEIPYDKMREIRKGLENGLNLSVYLRLRSGVIRQLRKAIVAGVNITKYINEGYDAEQLTEIREALEHGIDMEPYLSKEYRGASLAEIRKGLERGIDVSCYANIHYGWRQMREVRKGIEHRIPVEKYSNQLYSWEQMREIRLGLEQGLDVEEYRLLRYTAGEMRKKRLAMLDILNAEQEEILKNQVKSEDFMFEFTANDMEAYVTVLVQNKEITKENLMRILEQNNIRVGIQESTVERITSGRYGTQALLIAKGQLPDKGEDGWYEFFFRTEVDKKPTQLEDGSVDYQNIDWFEMVKVGQKLAYYHEALQGQDGCNVKGETIKARKGAEQRILTGKGFQLEDDKKTYTAIIDGMIKLEGNEMNITSHMVLDEVTMATGNISFQGSIHILGDVGYGTVVKATDDVVIEGTVEAATIESGGSIVLKKGMNASGHGLISADKDVVSKFFESAKVVAKGNIEVDKCLNSQLYAGGSIVSARALAGGTAQAEKGFRVNNVGNLAGLHTVLKLRVDEKVWEENKRLKSAIQDAKQELQMLNNAYEDFKVKFPPEVRSTMEMFIKLENSVFAKKRQLDQLMKLEEDTEHSIKKAKEAKIVITGCAHEGTLLEICGSRWLAKDQHNITVRKMDEEMEVVNN